MNRAGDRQLNDALQEALTRVEAERDRLRDTVYNGPQPGQRFGLCTDPVTGSTFAIHQGETIGQALQRLREQYREPVTGNGNR